MQKKKQFRAKVIWAERKLKDSCLFVRIVVAKLHVLSV